MGASTSSPQAMSAPEGEASMLLWCWETMGIPIAGGGSHRRCGSNCVKFVDTHAHVTTCTRTATTEKLQPPQLPVPSNKGGNKKLRSGIAQIEAKSPQNPSEAPLCSHQRQCGGGAETREGAAAAQLLRLIMSPPCTPVQKRGAGRLCFPSTPKAATSTRTGKCINASTHLENTSTAAPLVSLEATEEEEEPCESEENGSHDLASVRGQEGGGLTSASSSASSISSLVTHRCVHSAEEKEESLESSFCASTTNEVGAAPLVSTLHSDQPSHSQLRRLLPRLIDDEDAAAIRQKIRTALSAVLTSTTSTPQVAAASEDNDSSRSNNNSGSTGRRLIAPLISIAAAAAAMESGDWGSKARALPTDAPTQAPSPLSTAWCVGGGIAAAATCLWWTTQQRRGDINTTVHVPPAAAEEAASPIIPAAIGGSGSHPPPPPQMVHIASSSSSSPPTLAAAVGGDDDAPPPRQLMCFDDADDAMLSSPIAPRPPPLLLVLLSALDAAVTTSAEEESGEQLLRPLGITTSITSTATTTITAPRSGSSTTKGRRRMSLFVPIARRDVALLSRLLNAFARDAALLRGILSSLPHRYPPNRRPHNLGNADDVLFVEKGEDAGTETTASDAIATTTAAATAIEAAVSLVAPLVLRAGVDRPMRGPSLVGPLHEVALMGEGTTRGGNGHVNASTANNDNDDDADEEGGETSATAGTYSITTDPRRQANSSPNSRRMRGRKMRSTATTKTVSGAMALLLLQHGADVNALTSDGDTPLHCCWRFDSDEIAALLLDNGADPAAINFRGQTPLDLVTANSAGSSSNNNNNNYVAAPFPTFVGHQLPPTSHQQTPTDSSSTTAPLGDRPKVEALLRLA